MLCLLYLLRPEIALGDAIRIALGTPTVGSAFRAQKGARCPHYFSSTCFTGLLPSQKRVAEQTLGVPRITVYVLDHLAHSTIIVYAIFPS